MTFTHLPQVMNYLRSTHCIFAQTPFHDEWLSELTELKHQFDTVPALVGITYEAMTDASHGEIKTKVTISRLPNGAWEVTERAM